MTNFDHHQQGMLRLLKRLVETESPSHDKTAVDRIGAIVKEECLRIGAQVHIHPQTETGDLVEARFPSAQQENHKGILILAHMDTVFPSGTLTHQPYLEKDDKVFGPGVADMKGGIVVALSALAEVLETGKLIRPVTILFTSDEEIGSKNSLKTIENLSAESVLVLVLEPGMVDGALKTWRKGIGDYTIRVRGRAAHAGGDHEKGRNAIEEIAHQVLAIQKMTDYVTGTTLNVGIIRGGSASNVVPNEARVEVDLRVMQPGEAERIQHALESLKPILEGTSIEITGSLNRPPMPFDHAMKATFEKAKEIASTHDIDLKAGGSGGGSDANFVACLGIPVLDGLGPAGGEYHSEREFIIRDSLFERTRLLTALLSEW